MRILTLLALALLFTTCGADSKPTAAELAQRPVEIPDEERQAILERLRTATNPLMGSWEGLDNPDLQLSFDAQYFVTEADGAGNVRTQAYTVNSDCSGSNLVMDDPTVGDYLKFGDRCLEIQSFAADRMVLADPNTGERVTYTKIDN